MIQAQFNGDRVFSNSSEAFTLYEKSRFGEKISGRIEYSFAEALYLLKSRRAVVFSGQKSLVFDSLIKKIKNTIKE